MSNHNLNSWLKIKAIIICFLSMSFSQYSYPVRTFPENNLINATLASISRHFLDGQFLQPPTTSRSENESNAPSNPTGIAPNQSSAKKVDVTASISDVFICTDNGDGTSLIESTSLPGSTMRYFHGFDYTKPN